MHAPRTSWFKWLASACQVRQDCLRIRLHNEDAQGGTRSAWHWHLCPSPHSSQWLLKLPTTWCFIRETSVTGILPRSTSTVHSQILGSWGLGEFDMTVLCLCLTWYTANQEGWFPGIPGPSALLLPLERQRFWHRPLLESSGVYPQYLEVKLCCLESQA